MNPLNPNIMVPASHVDNVGRFSYDKIANIFLLHDYLGFDNPISTRGAPLKLRYEFLNKVKKYTSQEAGAQ